MRKVTFLIALFFSGITCVMAQGGDFAKRFADGEYHLQFQNYAEALPIFLELANADANNANVNYKAGLCYLNIPGQKTKAIPYLERATANTARNYEEFSPNEKRAPEIAHYDLGSAYLLDKQFEKASEAFNKYKGLIGTKNKELSKEVDRQINIAEFAARTTKAPVNVEFKNLGGLLNSKYPDYTPVLTPDESSIIFTSRRDGFGNYQNINGLYFESIFISNLQNGEWQAPLLISPNINADENDAILSISADGQKLLFYKDEKNNGNIFLSNAKGEMWDTPIELGANINSKTKEYGACLSPDGNLLFFASDKKGGKGGMDLYVSEKGKDGVWGPATNLNINTQYDEQFPWMAQDGKTLYFASDGHETMGGLDIVMCTYDAAAKTCSAPVNLGYPINTPDDDYSIVFTQDGRKAYVAQARQDSNGDYDIYEVFFKDKKPANITVFSGQIVNNIDPSASTWPTCKITVTNNSGGGSSQVYIANYNTGAFKFTMNNGSKYSIRVENEEKEIYKEELDLSAVKEFQEITKSIKLDPSIITEEERQAKLAEEQAKKAAAEEAARKAAEEEAKKAAEEAKAGGDKLVSDAKSANDPRKGAVKKPDPNSLPAAAPEFKTYFKYNMTDISATKDFNDFIKGVVNTTKAGKDITINIEASASKVPTQRYGTNEALAQRRAESAKTKINAALQKSGADMSKVKWGKLDSMVGGPEYNKDFNERRAEYEKYQYVDVSTN
jgi:Tol biopolymer transport system component